MKVMDKLKEISRYGKKRRTVGLPEPVIVKFLDSDPQLRDAVDLAYTEFQRLRQDYPSLLALPEDEQIAQLQKDFVNFYDAQSVNPYVALAAKGPWLITSCGAVVHDSGGYGMLGFGQDPSEVIAAMAGHQVMANIMTANFAQLRFVESLRQEIGHRRKDAKRHPFARFLCLNSGSESVTVASRITDINAKRETDPGGRHAGKTIKFLSMKGSFHGRTDRPSQVSDSTIGKYRQYLASYRGRDNLVTVAPNDSAALQAAFREAEAKGVYFEAMFLEPVMGEGNPGMAVTPAYYELARRLTRDHGCLLVIDSIQAGLRAHGCLSLCDYPGFEALDPPDMETYSKALNAGQYPLSVLAMGADVAKLYATGVYGNTMTANPRALDVACAVLKQVTPEVRRNINERGQEFLLRFAEMRQEFPDLITSVQGTGLLFSMGINKAKIKVVGEQGLELLLREQGLGVIHGGENALRFTPHFRISSQEINLMIDVMRRVFATL